MSDDIKKMMMPPPPRVIPPQITVTMTPDGLSVASNVPNMFTAVGMIIAAAFGLLLKNQSQEPEGRIVKLS